MSYSEKPKGSRRLILATGHSVRALRWLVANEAAFRQEVFASAVLLGFLWWLDISLADKLELFAAILFVMFAEVVNTSIETVVDRVGLEHHELSGLAKDLGSLSVLISLVITVVLWIKVLFIG